MNELVSIRGRISKNFPCSKVWWTKTFLMKNACFYGLMLSENTVNWNFATTKCNCRLLSIHQPGSVKHVFTGLPPIAKPSVQWRNEVMLYTCFWQVCLCVCAFPCKCCLCRVELRIHVIKMHRAQTIRKSSQTSKNLPSFLKSFILSGNFPFYPGIFQTVWKFSRLSRNLSGCPEIFQGVQKSSRLFRNLPDCSGHFPDCQDIFLTVGKSLKLSGNFKTVWKSSRLS